MEMRAGEETAMASDVTPAIPPLAAALHDKLLGSRCASCFRKVPPPRFDLPLSCRSCKSLYYCSAECRNADLDRHRSSGECRFSQFLGSDWQEETTDLRAALRLLQLYKNLGFNPAEEGSERIGGLIAADRGVPDEYFDLIARARAFFGDFIDEIERVLLVVLNNGVEVQVDDGFAVGIAVYSGDFSWFNHSCSPNSCYRFELRGSKGFSHDQMPLCHPSPENAKDEAMMGKLIQEEGRFNLGFCRFGPRVIVRSIRPIKKGEQVCITYTDLLQPKALRQSDLWTRYGFICSCIRCNASPETYVDRLLRGFKSDLSMETEEVTDALDQVVTDYLSSGNPDLCIEKIEEMVSRGFGSGSLQPFSHLSLKAFMALASMYRGKATDGAEAAAFSLMLAGTAHQLFLSDASLLVPAASFWVNAGESFFSLDNYPKFGPLKRPGFDRIFQHCSSCLTFDEFRATSSVTLSCIKRISLKVLPGLMAGIHCIRDKVKSPVDFSWFLGNNMGLEPLEDADFSISSCCIGCKCEREIGVRCDLGNISRLMIHCLVYGVYLGTVCYGPCSQWVDIHWSLLRNWVNFEREIDGPPSGY